MKLEFVYMPTRDLRAALTLYRDGLGWQEAWREGESTVSLKLPGTEVQLMLDATDPDAPFGPIFVVDSVHDFQASRPSELGIRMKPEAIPGGFMATFEDQSGNTIYVLDQSEAAAAPGTG
jgi:predicted enzyme related to lactoylglutathione lyase